MARDNKTQCLVNVTLNRLIVMLIMHQQNTRIGHTCIRIILRGAFKF